MPKTLRFVAESRIGHRAGRQASVSSSRAVRRGSWTVSCPVTVLVAVVWWMNPTVAAAQRPGGEVAIEMIQRWDANQDGQLTQDEIPARARPAIQKLAREAGLKPQEGLPLDRLVQQVRTETSRGAKEKEVGAPRAVTSQAELPGEGKPPLEPRSTEAESGESPRRANGFGASTEVRSAKGFGDRNSSTPTTVSSTRPEPTASDAKKDAKQQESPSGGSEEERRIRPLAQSLLRRYDRNKNGVLEKEEWSRMRGNPETSDGNGDGILTIDELVVHLSSYSRNRGRSTAATARDSSTNTTAASGRSRVVRDGSATGSNSARSYRFLTATERVAKKIPRELLDWFLGKDRDGDGQIAMSEFSSSWSNETAQEFARMDLDNDGLVTPREYTKAKNVR